MSADVERLAALQRRSHEERVDDHAQRLREVITIASEASEGWRTRLVAAGVKVDEPGPIDVSKLPVLRKADLLERQAARPPLGGFTTKPLHEFARVFMSPGPIFDPLDFADEWGFGEGLHVAGFAGGDVVLNAFSYHLTPAGHAFEQGASRLGATVIPAGTASTEQIATVIRALRPTAFIGTPSHLRILTDRTGWRFSRAAVSGEKMSETDRAVLEHSGGSIRQIYGTADVGYVAAECEFADGLHVSEFLDVEIVDPEGDVEVPDGEIGELVVTNFATGYPMLRFGTGDLSRVASRDTCRCGRTGPRLEGILGRSGPGTKVRGMFVYPHLVTDALNRSNLSAGQLVITRENGEDVLVLRADVPADDEKRIETIRRVFRDVIKLSMTVESVATVSPTDPVLLDERVF
ncbi:phenylacetate--CoA ligase family protein [Aeromicrobium piscarium]|uniref:Phenylacetate--CoA ligase n=1 Tax=Aeromicrobium piscarium TaxID=2590901 RepID=A0A554S7R1_9ACTN|nr:AMP-binding protein [Aeromicrobium piscarium]TSD62390.1 phenylacetate--CoA ligase [Aeromicrobium piscarium]